MQEETKIDKELYLITQYLDPYSQKPVDWLKAKDALNTIKAYIRFCECSYTTATQVILSLRKESKNVKRKRE